MYARRRPQPSNPSSDAPQRISHTVRRKAAIRAPNDHHVSPRAYPHIGTRSHTLLYPTQLPRGCCRCMCTTKSTWLTRFVRFVQRLPSRGVACNVRPAPNNGRKLVYPAQNHAPGECLLRRAQLGIGISIPTLYHQSHLQVAVTSLHHNGIDAQTSLRVQRGFQSIETQALTAFEAISGFRVAVWIRSMGFGGSILWGWVFRWGGARRVYSPES